ncbi:hypothetical protein [Gandjariella thermophila]|uniref:Cobyrinic acid a,c-diamide synthase n=1 Tax=Gandjariella thermophila TaxID=1931992 RepID=A0A4D4JF01_9PSEU|nr:hypothetical protein [Gandjariella thermophila]GDY33600.1 hypothetical protein GTS_52330 [Gandjariella thermophila]
MTRRASLPGAAELFRSTTLAGKGNGELPAGPPEPDTEPLPGGSGRQKHDAKITVYVSQAELVALEQARLRLRADYGLGVDRGRVVREAIAVLLGDLEARGEESLLVRRLRRERER